MDQPATEQRFRAETYKEIYINAATIGGSAYDLLLIGLLTKQQPNGTAMNEEQIGLRTSPQQFKSLVGMMLEVIFSYERDIQILKLPPEQARREAMLESIREVVTAALPSRAIFAGPSTEQPLPAERSRAVRPKKAKKP
jgi:hypothetical protein